MESTGSTYSPGQTHKKNCVPNVVIMSVPSTLHNLLLTAGRFACEK
jgi:hypothetical protein